MVGSVVTDNTAGAPDVAQDEPLAEVEADVQVPLLPDDVVAVHLERRALRLHHLHQRV